MNNYVKNKYIIAGITVVYCIFIGILYSISNLSFNFIMINSGIVLLTMVLNVLISGIFLFAIDAFVRQKKPFKMRFFELTKSLWIAQLILFPISLIMLILTPFVGMQSIMTVKIITFVLRYLCPFVLFFSYKLITGSDWPTTIKVVSITFIMMTLITQILHLI